MIILNILIRITFDETYYLNMMKKIIKTVSDNQFKVDKYFAHILLNILSEKKSKVKHKKNKDSSSSEKKVKKKKIIKVIKGE